jgi:HAD-hyrolase-like
MLRIIGMAQHDKEGIGELVQRSAEEPRKKVWTPAGCWLLGRGDGLCPKTRLMGAHSWHVAEPVVARFHVGDTPMDLQAAEMAGAVGVGVTTGIYSKEELEACGTGGVVLQCHLWVKRVEYLQPGGFWGGGLQLFAALIMIFVFGLTMRVT